MNLCTLLFVPHFWSCSFLKLCCVSLPVPVKIPRMNLFSAQIAPFPSFRLFFLSFVFVLPSLFLFVPSIFLLFFQFFFLFLVFSFASNSKENQTDCLKWWENQVILSAEKKERKEGSERGNFLLLPLFSYLFSISLHRRWSEERKKRMEIKGNKYYR